MKYGHIVMGTFIRRPNRFIAQVEIDGDEETVHVKNTGRCSELLLPGAKVVLEQAVPRDPRGHGVRKTLYSLIAVYKGSLLVNIDSQAPNRVVKESAAAGLLDQAAGGSFCNLRSEVVFGRSRFDLSWETEAGQKAYLEVKGVTLEDAGVVRFPDAPTERGTRHVLEMIDVVRSGYRGYLLFLIQLKGALWFEPHDKMDRRFAEALRQAHQAGVRLLAYDTLVERDSMTLGEPVEIRL